MALDDQIRDALDFLRTAAIDDALKDLPVLGNDLADKVPDLGLDAFRDALADAIQDIDLLPTPAQRADALETAIAALSPIYPGLKTQRDGTVVSILIEETFSTMASTGDKALGAESTAAKLTLQGALTGTFSADLRLRFDYSADDNTLEYVDQEGAELDLKAELDVSYATGASLGEEAFAFTLTDANDDYEVTARFGLDLSSLSPLSITPTATGEMLFKPRITLSVLENLLPSIYAEFEIGYDLSKEDGFSMAIPDVGVDVSSLVAQLEFILEPITQLLFDGPVGAVLEERLINTFGCANVTA